MKKILFYFIILLIMMNIGFGEPENHIIYNVIKDTTIVEHTINYSIEQKRIELIIPLDATAIETNNLPFSIEKNGDHNIIIIENAKNVQVKYISDFFIEKTSDRFFTINLGLIEGNKDVTVILPEHAYFKYVIGSQKNSLIPTTEDIRTDGIRIRIHWDKSILKNANSILVIYNVGAKGFNFSLILLWFFSILLIIGGFYFFLNKKHKKDIAAIKKNISSEDITKNLFDEEKKIVEVLLEHKGKEMWQKQLLLKTGLSKVKLSRKLRNLEFKEIIEKIPYGNTNKVRIKPK